MTPTDLHPGLSISVACIRCDQHARDLRAARAETARHRSLALAREQHLDSARREIATLEQQIARGRPTLLATEATP